MTVKCHLFERETRTRVSICRDIIRGFVIIALLYIALYVCYTIVNNFAPSYSRLRPYHSYAVGHPYADCYLPVRFIQMRQSVIHARPPLRNTVLPAKLYSLWIAFFCVLLLSVRSTALLTKQNYYVMRLYNGVSHHDQCIDAIYRPFH